MDTERYNRQILLSEIGEKGQQKLLDAKVLVIGAGGLGCPALLYLAGAGIGTIGIIDFDTVAVSNLHRQIIYTVAEVGSNKALAAKKRLEALNPSISITAYPEKLTTANAISLFKQYDIILDGSDNFSTRYLVNDACIITNKPLVYGAIFKFQGQVAVFNYQNGPSYRCLFPNPPEAGSVPSCNEAGVLGVLPGIIGGMQANEVLKIILEIGTVLSGKIQLYSTLSNEMSAIKLKRNQEEIDKVLTAASEFTTTDYDLFCGIKNTVDIITFSETNNLKEAVFVDVREFYEQPKAPFLNPIELPLSSLESNLDKLPTNLPIVTFCQAGIRSIKAATLLKLAGFNQVYSLKEGAPEIIMNQNKVL